MKDLGEVSELPLKLNLRPNRLIIGRGLSQVSALPRRLEDMREVLYDPSASGPEVVYLMYRDICFSEHRKLLRRHRLRHDVIVMPPGRIGVEFVKTKGHVHETIPGLKHTYPEVYTVLSGIAHYLLQRMKHSPVRGGTLVKDGVLIVAEAGDKVIIPPNYAHVTINAQEETLVVANWVGTNCSSIYAPLEACQGAGYYVIEDEGKIRFLRNRRYLKVPKLRKVQVSQLPSFGFSKEKPAYVTVVENPSRFKYLTEPTNHLDSLNEALAK